MEMDVEYGLTGIPTIIDHHAISILLQSLLARDRSGHEKEMPDDLSVRDLDAVNVRYMSLGNDQRMDRRLWVQVLESDCELILVQDRCRDLLFDDLAENAVRITAHDFPSSVSVNPR